MTDVHIPFARDIPKYYTQTDNGSAVEKTVPKPMYIEQNRLASYSGWQCKFLQPQDLAKKGFYYTHVNDVVRCAFCGIEIGHWEEGDSIDLDHRRYSEHCSFLNNRSRNVPLGLETRNMPTSGEDTCGKYGLLEMRPFSCLERGPSNTYRELNLPNIAKPMAYPEYKTLEKRLESFKDWPLSLAQRPNVLADAGFFYTGKSDQTICFFCGGGLKDWERNDDPWEQHGIWFSKCNYLLLQKGHEFVKSVSNKNSAVPQPERATNNVETQQNHSTSAPSSSSTSKPVNSNKPSEETSQNMATTCKICYNKEIGVVFLPCGHICSCVDCATGLEKCAMCRSEIIAVNRVFLS